MAGIDKGNLPKKGDVDPVLGDPIPKSYLDKATAELKAGCRQAEVMRDGQPFSIIIKHPSIRQEVEINKIYTAEFNRLFKDPDYMTRKEILASLKKRKIITPIQEKEIEQLQNSLKNMIEDYNLMLVEEKATPEKLAEVRASYYDIRDRLVEKNAEMNEHLSNSIESSAEQIQIFNKMVVCITDIDNNPVWNSVDELYDDANRNFVTACMYEAQLFWSNVSKEILHDLPGVIDELHRGETSENSQEVVGNSTT